MNAHSTDGSLDPNVSASEKFQGSNPARSTDSPNAEPDLGELMDRFMQECREGRNPSVEDYARENPELAEEIRDMFPALLALEKGGVSESFASSQKGIEPVVLERLGNYRIVRELGRGGMGVVYEALDETLERVVALKVMKIFPGEEEQTTKRFHREAKIAAGLHHTNIVPVYGSGSVDNKLFYAMQLIEGVSLEKFLQIREKDAPPSDLCSTIEPERVLANEKTNVSFLNDDFVVSTGANKESQNSSDNLGELSVSEMKQLLDDRANATDEKNTAATTSRQPNSSLASKSKFTNLSQLFNPFLSSNKTLRSVHMSNSNYYQRVCDIGIQAAQGLEHAHRNNVIHRDVKPSNLILDKDGVVWITDFGLAKLMGDNDLTRQGQPIGTLRYLAPESLEGDFSPKSDVYSLGLTLYELLTFTPAFNETNYTKLYSQVQAGVPVRPRKIAPQIPRDLETIVLKAMDRLPEKRYETAGEMADDLRRFLEERPIQARRIGLLEKTWRWYKRNKLVASLLFSIFFLVNLLLVYMTVSYKQVQSESATRKENLQIALNAFDNIFKNLSKDSNLSLDLSDEISSFYALNQETTIDDKEKLTLENLLGFYNKFAETNKDDPTFLPQSALAHARIGKIRRLSGSANSSEAFTTALDQYQSSLKMERSPEDREQLILEKANLLNEWFGNEPVRELEKASKACSETLKELETCKQTETRDNLVVKLRFLRAIIELLSVRRSSSRVLSLFETPVYQLPSPEKQEQIKKDFEAVIERFQSPKTSNQWFQLCQSYSSSALWYATIGNIKEAQKLIKQGEDAVDAFEKECRDRQEPSVYYARISQSFLKALVEIETYNSTNDPQEKAAMLKAYSADKERTLEEVDKLAKDFSESPKEVATQPFVYYRFARLEARIRNLDEVRNLLEISERQMQSFTQKFQDNEKFLFFKPLLYESFAELTLREGRLDDASSYIRNLEDNLSRLESQSNGDSSANNADYVNRRRECLKALKSAWSASSKGKK